MMAGVCAVLVLVAMPLEAWGPQGHRLVARIAEARLTPVARQNVRWLLDGVSTISGTWRRWKEWCRRGRRNRLEERQRSGPVSRDLARSALVRANADVGETYYANHIGIVDERLAIAGLRLALVLNRSLSTPPPRR